MIPMSPMSGRETSGALATNAIVRRGSLSARRRCADADREMSVDRRKQEPPGRAHRLLELLSSGSDGRLFRIAMPMRASGPGRAVVLLLVRQGRIGRTPPEHSQSSERGAR